MSHWNIGEKQLDEPTNLERSALKMLKEQQQSKEWMPPCPIVEKLPIPQSSELKTFEFKNNKFEVLHEDFDGNIKQTIFINDDCVDEYTVVNIIKWLRREVLGDISTSSEYAKGGYPTPRREYSTSSGGATGPLVTNSNASTSNSGSIETRKADTSVPRKVVYDTPKISSSDGLEVVDLMKLDGVISSY